MLTATARAHPDAAAIDDGEMTLTYGQLLAVVRRTVARLGEVGVGRGSRVGIRMPSGSRDLYVAILATLYAGAAYVPVDADGTLGIVDGRSAPGKSLALRADRDVIVLVSNCPQINNPCNGFDPTAVELDISEAAA